MNLQKPRGCAVLAINVVAIERAVPDSMKEFYGALLNQLRTFHVSSPQVLVAPEPEAPEEPLPVVPNHTWLHYITHVNSGIALGVLMAVLILLHVLSILYIVRLYLKVEQLNTIVEQLGSIKSKKDTPHSIEL